MDYVLDLLWIDVEYYLLEILADFVLIFIDLGIVICTDCNLHPKSKWINQVLLFETIFISKNIFHQIMDDVSIYELKNSKWKLFRQIKCFRIDKNITFCTPINCHILNFNHFYDRGYIFCFLSLFRFIIIIK